MNINKSFLTKRTIPDRGHYWVTCCGPREVMAVPFTEPSLRHRTGASERCPDWGQAGSLLCLWPPILWRGKNCIFSGTTQVAQPPGRAGPRENRCTSHFPLPHGCGRSAQLKEYPISCKLKPTFSSTQDQALWQHQTPAYLPAYPLPPPLRTRPLSDPPTELLVIPQILLQAFAPARPSSPPDCLFSTAGWNVTGEAFPASAGFAPAWPLRASWAGVCLWQLLYCTVTNSVLLCPPGLWRLGLCLASPVCPQGLTDSGMKPLAAKSHYIKEQSSLPSTQSLSPLASCVIIRVKELPTFSNVSKIISPNAWPAKVCQFNSYK